MSENNRKINVLNIRLLKIIRPIFSGLESREDEQFLTE
jgi:hypothetical protein